MKSSKCSAGLFGLMSFSEVHEIFLESMLFLFSELLRLFEMIFLGLFEIKWLLVNSSGIKG